MPSVEEIMRKAETEKTDLYASRNALKGHEERKDERKKERKERKAKLQQWFGMKKQTLTPEVEQELELLKYRNFLNKDTAHLAPKKTSSSVNTEFFEFGYVVGTGQKKRKQYKSFADEWLDEDRDLAEKIQKRVHANVKRNRREKTKAAALKQRKAMKAKDRRGGKKTGKKK